MAALEDRVDPPDPRLDDRVMELLAAHAGRLAFNGLRRTLGAHPESLARALRRLERSGLVGRVDGAYVLRDAPAPSPRSPARADLPVRTVGSVSLPAGIGAHELFGTLAGRWFGSLRWVGVYENPGDPWLVWAAADGSGHVFLSVRRRNLRVLVDRNREDPRADDLDAAAHELLVQGLTRLRRVDRGATPTVAFLAEPVHRPGGTEN